MDTANYDPWTHLCQLFDSPESLDEIPDLLTYTDQYKHQLDQEINEQIEKYDKTAGNRLNDDIRDLIEMIQTIKLDSSETQSSISAMTSSIQQLDQYKKNLVLSMTVLQRLQMLINANDTLISIIPSRNYEKILQSLSVIKELLAFFRPYKSIDEINQLSLTVMKTQHKLVDDIFTDFEVFVKHTYDQEEQLKYGCEILELIDKKYKDKLLNWYYNYQLKDIKVIFNNYDEAGSLENLSRRYIYFNNILSTIQSSMSIIFPEIWHIDFEFSKLFCQLTKEDLTKLLTSKRNAPVNSQIVLDNLHHTLDFERSLEERFQSAEFNQIISSVFEPYLTIWVQEQDKYLQSKFLEYLSTSQLPTELQSMNQQEFMTILKVNNVPNIANSSIDLFKTFQKILTQILKLSNGPILIDLCQLFIKYLFDYHTRILLPILPVNEEDLATMEAIKYVTMLLNTGDYIINNIDDLSDKFVNLIQPQYKSRIPSFDSIKDVYYRLITRSIACLVTKIGENLRPIWRQFVNQNWQQLDSVNDVSTYMQDLIVVVKENNIMIILPLIIRDSYVRTVCDKTIELIITSVANNLSQIKPLSAIMLQQILLDIDIFKSVAVNFTLYSDANYGNKLDNQQVINGKDSSKSYVKFVNHQFGSLESLLKLLMTPNKPIEALIEQYFVLIKDSSIANFIKVLNLKSVDYDCHQKYLENFQLQLTIENDSLIKSSSLLSNLQEDKPQDFPGTSTSSSPPEIKSPKLLPGNFPTNKINLNLEKGFRDFAINGENNISKFNENFKNFGKFFRKEDR